MKDFLAKFSTQIKGTISGFDRLVIKGMFKNLSYVEGMFGFLLSEKVLLKDFGEYVERKTNEFKEKSYAYVKQLDRPIEYLPSSGIRKKEYAEKIMGREGIKEGLICLLTAVEPFYGYSIYKNREQKKLELVKRERKCLHLYYYWNDREFGMMGARIQTWFPFTCYIYLNGREWLEKMMESEGLSYEKKENCFLDISDFSKAQQLLARQLTLDWPKKLEKIAYTINPLYNTFKKENGLDYYCSGLSRFQYRTDYILSFRLRNSYKHRFL